MRKNIDGTGLPIAFAVTTKNVNIEAVLTLAYRHEEGQRPAGLPWLETRR